ncbi:hypothetical protein LEP1GSC203_2901 [Leptospira terpstrae serovar Hualin str. LT 11-33 = ATCC 700639]|uniref:Uncharacterized protein n=1 Tax=Leptospira terpstrae serovar Hualin str. LT 11-33 = ATCC 700639 TaxID=1257025 RepID=N1VWV6_9LEPT|nr:hypothetical protein LEP1GSC203_2901 [Leptospira terpstrae serovar Hualin str. LT 11-33 = ATCC 700639]
MLTLAKLVIAFNLINAYWIKVYCNEVLFFRKIIKKIWNQNCFFFFQNIK